MNDTPLRSRMILTLTVVALLVMACASTPAADADRRRPVRPGPAGPAQWSHEWSNGAVYYEIFVRSFEDSNGDGIGDINGLISKLDYLNDGDPTTKTDLGVDALWLMPVFESPSYHGYDVIDYEKIEKDYGTNEDFQRLLTEAHKRGIRVIVDFVMNHSSWQNPWFIDSASSTTSAKRNWYVWNPTDKGWTQPWGGSYPTWHEKNGAYYYGVFWAGMPDLNFEEPQVREEIKRLAAEWLNAGVDGFRLDATRYIVETGAGPTGQADTQPTHAFLREFSSLVRTTKPGSILVAENWTETPIIATYYGSTSTIKGGDEMPMNFDFPLSSSVIEGIQKGDAMPVAEKLREIQRTYPEGIIDTPFLTNHDQTRLATTLGNNSGKLRNAAAVLLTLPGAPFLYYGEEVGIQNGPTTGDESKRTPMPWSDASGGGFTTGTPWFQFAPGRSTANVATQSGDPSSLLSRYRLFIDARKSSPALSKGDLGVLTPATGVSPVLAFTRATSEERVLVVHNLSDGFVTAGPYDVGAATSTEKIFADTTVTTPSVSGGKVTVSLPPRTSGVFRLK